MEAAHYTYCDFFVKGSCLDAMDFSGKSDPYIVIKCPTHLITKRNIFEYEMDLIDTLGSSRILKDSQGNIMVSCDSSKSLDTNLIASVAASTLHASGSHYHGRKAHPQTEGYKEIYESEVVKATLDPIWNAFRIGFYEMCRGNILVELLVECYDWDRFKTSDFIGSCKVTVKDLLEAKTDRFQLLNKENKPSGKLYIRCKPSECDLTYFDFKASGHDLGEKHAPGKLPDPFFIIKAHAIVPEERNSFSRDNHAPPLAKTRSGGILSHIEEYRDVYESRIVRTSVNPEWGIFQLGYYDLCRGNMDTKLLIECYDYNDFIPNKFIGSAEVSTRELLNATGGHLIQLHSKKHKRPAGSINIHCKPSNLIAIKNDVAHKWHSAHVADINISTENINKLVL